ncbi:hypothetical protein [Fusobacterium polymorphum]|uniref:hypothetical protein n=1 Tax=Fusobacterium nucleatum subsp. polymorphum TaxID=76857 RepID=UPI00300A83BD
MSYKKCIVIFLDILGTQNRESFEELYKINNIFHSKLEDNLKNNERSVIYKRTIHTFSDCAYIIYDYKDNIKDTRKDIGLLTRVSIFNTIILVQNLLKEGFLVRGGISFGDVYYETERSLFFGPAINKAYQLESKEAIYPRILLSNEIVAIFKRSIYNSFKKIKKEVIEYEIPEWQSNLTFDDLNIEDNFIIMDKDYDNKYMLNYLYTFEYGTNIDFNLEEVLINNIEKNKNIITSKKIQNKYEWLEKYLRSVKLRLFLRENQDMLFF